MLTTKCPPEAEELQAQLIRAVLTSRGGRTARLIASVRDAFGDIRARFAAWSLHDLRRPS
jgi:hypothetical protein